MIRPEECNAFASRLYALEDQRGDKTGGYARGILAQLRHGRGKEYGEWPARDGWVQNQLDELWQSRPSPDHPVHDRIIERACLVASLFADHEGHASDSMAEAARQYWLENDKPSAFANRFAQLIETDSRDLAIRLRQFVSLLAAKDVRFAWGRLFFDLTRWDAPNRPIQRAWSRQFWMKRVQRKAKTSNHNQ